MSTMIAETATGSSDVGEVIGGMSEAAVARLVAPLDLRPLVRVDSHLAQGIRSLVEMAEAGDWDAARVMSHAVAQRVRILELTSRQDEAGVVR